VEQTALWCPRCLQPVGRASTCPRCGLPQPGPDAARLRQVVHRLYQVEERRRALAVEADALGRERHRLLQALDPAPAVAPAPARPEWRPAVVRGVLLGVGSVLVALAALIFSAVAWVRLGDPGRAALLAGVTLAVAAGAAAARRRLPATAEALGLLALALLLVDWYAVRRAGVGGDWPAATWWALGTAAAAALAAMAGRHLPLQLPAAAALAQISALLVAAGVADTPWTLATGLALVAAAATAAAGLAAGTAWRRAAAAFWVGGAVLELVALALLLLAPGADDPGGPALALAATALAPAVARAMAVGWSGPVAGHGLVAASAGALLAAAGTLLSARWASWSLAAAVAVLGAAGVAAGRLLPRPLAAGTALAAAATLAIGLAGLAEPILWALAAPAGWLADPWTARLAMSVPDALRPGWPAGAGPGGAWPAVVGLLAGLAGAGAAAVPGRGWPARASRLATAVGVAAAAGLVAAVPLAAGWPLWATLASATAAGLAAGTTAVLLDRRTTEAAAAKASPSLRGLRPTAPAAADGDLVARTPATGDPARVAAAAGAALLLLAGAWALASEAGTLWFLGVVAVAAVAGTGASRSGWLRGGWGAVGAAAVVAGGAAVAAAAGAGAAQAGFATTVAAGLVLVAGARWRSGAAEGPVVEAAGLLGLALGVGVAAAGQARLDLGGGVTVGGQRWLAAALSVAVPPLLLAAAEPGRRGYRWAASAAAVAATWAWLVVAEVTLLEAYTLPAAAAALAGGMAARRRQPRPGSWAAYGPGLAVALLPSLGLAVGDQDPARPLLLSGGALLAVLVGARARLQAPLVLGAATLVLLALDAALPVAARLPRWASVGGIGLLLLWLGATAERRLARLRRFRRQLGDLEPDGPAG
jgi:hypothetical protein